MSQFDFGKKIFFLYPPVEFSNTILRKLFEEGYELYKLNSTKNLFPLLKTYPDSLLFLNSDYPYEDFDLTAFYSRLKEDQNLQTLQVYAFFFEGVTFGEQIKDYISLDQPEDDLTGQFRTILSHEEAHGKRANVRFGSYSETICRFSFHCGGSMIEADLLDISPQALSFSAETDLKPFLKQPLSNVHLTVGAFTIDVSGTLSQKRQIGGKTIYIATFDGTEYQRDLFNFIFTSLEKRMDEIIHSLKGE